MKRAKIILLNIVILIILLCLLDVGLLYLYGHKQTNRQESLTESYFYDEDTLGYASVKDVKSHVELKIDGEVIYSTDYEFDHHGRRITPVENKSSRKKFAIFLGGSNTFGEGLQPTQTLPYYFTEKMKDYNPYNYAFRGYGTNHVLALLESERLKTEITEKEGVGVYQYFTFHRNRLLGTSHYFSWSNGRSPSYVLEDGELKNVGLFNKGRYFYYYGLRYLNYLRFFGLLNISFPDIHSEYSNRLMCEVLKKSKTVFLEQFPSSQFVIVLAVNTESKDTIVDDCLEPQQISYIDLRKQWGEERGSITIKEDVEPHFNERVNQFVAEKLQHWLEDGSKKD